jgi:hypothetical protein
MKNNSIFESPEELFRKAIEKGIISIVSEGDLEKINDFLSGHRIQLSILHPKQWIDFLMDIRQKTKHSAEYTFVDKLIDEFAKAIEDSKISLEELEKRSNNLSLDITDEKIEKMKKIDTVDKFIKSIESGEL